MENLILKDEFFLNTNTGYSVLVKECPNKDLLIKNIKFIKKLDEIIFFRGKIISLSTSIENLINSNIEFILFDKKDKNTELFQNLFLRSNNLTFFSKWNIFKELCKNVDKVKGNYKSDLITDINLIIEIRNNIAHGYLIYNYKNNKFYLEYVKKGLIKNIEITIDYMNNSIKQLYNCINNINLLVFGENTTIKEVNIIKTKEIFNMNKK